MLNTILGTKKTAKKGKKGAAKGKKKTAKATKKTTKKSASAASPALNSKKVIDVRSKADVKDLVDLFKKNKVVVVLVYADWCGHCTTFKEDVWSKLSNMPSRKVPMAQIKAEELPNTPLANAEVDGYPSVMVVGNDMKPTNIENSRDMSLMTKIVNSDPDKVLANVPGAEATATSPEGSVVPTPEAEEAQKNESEKVLQTVNVGSLKPNNKGPANSAIKAELENLSMPSVANPPPVEEDVISPDSAMPSSNSPFANSLGTVSNTSASMNNGTISDSMGVTPPFENDSLTGSMASGPLVGGSLYRALYNISKGRESFYGPSRRRTRRASQKKGKRSTRRR